jgi:hypothetical protein
MCTSVYEHGERAYRNTWSNVERMFGVQKVELSILPQERISGSNITPEIDTKHQMR